MNQEKTRSDLAVEKLVKEQEAALKVFNGSATSILIKRSLIKPISEMLMKFCYQNEEFAQGVIRNEKTVADCVTEISKKVTRDNPSLSDVEAYAEAVKFYLPAARVTVSFRILLPEERDDDLLFFDINQDGSLADEGSAMILDLFNTEEV